MKTGARRQARELALKVLYSLYDQEDKDLTAVLADFWQEFRFQEDSLGEVASEENAPPALPSAKVRAFAEQLVKGVYEYVEPIDDVISRHATNWPLDRMDRVDLSLLRLAVYEICYESEVPAQVAINEAIEISKRYGSQHSPGFINGVLDSVHLTCQQNPTATCDRS